jgi:hypothetical protein
LVPLRPKFIKGTADISESADCDVQLISWQTFVAERFHVVVLSAGTAILFLELGS